MSKVYIEGMEMPKSCSDCPFKWTDSETVDVCDLLDRLGKNYEAYLGKQTGYADFKSKDCPLREVKQ